MKNFDLKKYLAENKLLKEQPKNHPLTDAMKIHFQVAYEKGLEAQPEDDYGSFDEKYWKNNAFEIDSTIRRFQQKSDDDLRDTYNQYGSFKEEVNEGYEQEQSKLTSSLMRWIQYSMDNGDSKEEVLATLERLGERIINKLPLAENKLLNESLELTPIERRKLIYFLEMKVEEMQNKGDNFFSDEIGIFNSILNKIR